VKKTRLVLPLLLLAAALALAACGGGDSGGGEESKIEEAIEESATSTDPSKCTEFETQKLIETETEQSGKAAVKTCEEEAKSTEGQPESVDVSKINVDGEKATADVMIKGGTADGQGIEVALVEEDGNWKLDEFVKFSDYNAAAMTKSFEEAFEQEEGLTPELAKCLTKGFGELSQEDAESIILDKDPEAIEQLVKSCQ
jgi:predicted small secreted protein